MSTYFWDSNMFQAFQLIRDHIDKCSFCNKICIDRDIRKIGNRSICTDCVDQLNKLIDFPEMESNE